LASIGYFIASVPALAGCHSQAKSLDELMERIREAIELCLEFEQEQDSFAHSLQDQAIALRESAIALLSTKRRSHSCKSNKKRSEELFSQRSRTQSPIISRDRRRRAKPSLREREGLVDIAPKIEKVRYEES